jgi:protein tyrosine phosphatase
MYNFERNLQTNYDKIINFLYIGNIKSVESDNTPFTLIVNCTHDVRFPMKCGYGIRLAVNDDPTECSRLLMLMNDSNVLEQIHTCVQNNKPVLVHCFAGMQRSCAVVACYLIKYYKMKPDEAINYIRSRRSIAFYGGANFMNAMNQFYENLHH